MRKERYLDFYRIKKEFKDKYEEWCNVLKDFYGENIEIGEIKRLNLENIRTQTRYDDEFETNIERLKDYFKRDISFKFRILFPEITISNSLGLTYNIKDLVVEITNKFESCYFSGTRLTLSNEEWASKYFHSHLPKSENLGKFDTFCLGYDTVMKKLSDSGLFSVDSNIFPFILNDYVSWESLEGGPYIQIEHIGTRVSFDAIIQKNIYSPDIEEAFHIRTNLKVGKDFKIKNKREISEELALHPLVPKIVDINGQLYENSEKMVIFNSTEFQFNNKTIQTKIYETEKKNEYEKYYTHPQFLEEYCEYWEGKFYQNFATNDYIKKQNQVKNYQKITSAN